jgi:hypothetical protein
MRHELKRFKQQLLELQQRSTVTAMFNSYTKPSQNDEDLHIYSGLSQNKQFFLLRKQYDQRMKQLALLGDNQRKQIAKFEHMLQQFEQENNNPNEFEDKDARFEREFNELMKEKKALMKEQEGR